MVPSRCHGKKAVDDSRTLLLSPHMPVAPLQLAQIPKGEGGQPCGNNAGGRSTVGAKAGGVGGIDDPVSGLFRVHTFIYTYIHT